MVLIRLVHIPLLLHKAPIAKAIAQRDDRLRVILVFEAVEILSLADQQQICRLMRLIDSAVQVCGGDIRAAGVALRTGRPAREVRTVQVRSSQACAAKVRAGKRRTIQAGRYELRAIEHRPPVASVLPLPPLASAPLRRASLSWMAWLIPLSCRHREGGGRPSPHSHRELPLVLAAPRQIRTVERRIRENPGAVQVGVNQDRPCQIRT